MAVVSPGLVAVSPGGLTQLDLGPTFSHSTEAGPRTQRLRDGSESTQSLRGALNSSQAGSPLPPCTASMERCREFRKARGHFGRLVSAIDRKKSDVSSVSRLTFMPFTSRLLLFACHPA